MGISFLVQLKPLEFPPLSNQAIRLSALSTIAYKVHGLDGFFTD